MITDYRSLNMHQLDKYSANKWEIPFFDTVLLL